MKDALPTIKIGVFEGPLDLLLELAQTKQLDVSDITLQNITDDFLHYIKDHDITPDIQGSFLIVVSTLLLLKVRRLLPSLTDEEEEEVADLTDRVRIYQLYRRQAQDMRTLWNVRRLLPARSLTYGTFSPVIQHETFPECSLTELGNHMNAVVHSLPKSTVPKAHLPTQGKTLKECLALLTRRLKRVKQLIFQEAIKGASREDASVSFLAILELAKEKRVDLEQDKPFEKLLVRQQS